MALIFDVTVPDTYAESNLHDTACRPGAAADKAAANKSSKYCDLAGTHLFFPIAIETAGTWNQMADELVQEVGRRIRLVTEDTRETVFLPCDAVCTVSVIVILSVRLSVRLSVTLVDCVHTVRPTIMISSAYGSPIILVSGDIKFIPKFEGSHPERGR